MAPRREVTLRITFGPASTPVFGSAVAYAGEHAQGVDRLGPRTYRASFVLGRAGLATALERARATKN